MRRKYLRILMGALTFFIGTLLVNEIRRPAIVHSHSSAGFTLPDGTRVSNSREIFPSTVGAATQFDSLLAASPDYLEFEPCYDSDGRQIGERALLLGRTLDSSKQTWRIAWTQQEKEFSELYWVEADSLDAVRIQEKVEHSGWHKCIIRRSNQESTFFYFRALR